LSFLLFDFINYSLSKPQGVAKIALHCARLPMSLVPSFGKNQWFWC